MKTRLFLGIAFLFFYSVSSAQERSTNFENLTVVATSAGMAAQLTWKKGDENIAFFIVERSTDGIDFKQCGIVWLSEDPAFVDYKFRDRLAANNSGLLYRIGMVNTSRRVTYLPVRKLLAPETM